MKTCDKTTVAPGQTFTYTIRYRVASLTEHAFNATISDPIPAGIEVLSYTLAGGQVGSVSVGGNNITWALQTPGGVPGRLDAGSTGLVTVTARFPACATGGATAGAFNNTASFAATGATTVTSSVSITLSSNVPVCPAVPPLTVGLLKYGSNGKMSASNGAMNYAIDLPASASSFTITDIIPNGMVVTDIYRRLSPSNTYVKLEIQCANSGQWFTVFDATNTSFNNFYRTNELPPAALECIGVPNPLNSLETVFNITAVRWTIPAGVGVSNLNGTNALRVYSLDPNPFAGVTVNFAAGGSGPAMPGYVPLVAGGTVTNCVTSSDITMGSGGQSCEQTDLAPVGPTPNLFKKIVGSPSVPYPTNIGNFIGSPAINPNSNPPIVQGDNDLVYGFRFSHAEEFASNWPNPVITDLLDPNVEYLPYPAGTNWWTVAIEDEASFPAGQNAYNDPDCFNPTFTAIPNFNGTGRTLLRWDFSNCTNYGAGHSTHMYLYYSVRIKAGTPAGTVISDMNISPLPTNANLCECANGSLAGTTENAYWAGTTDALDFDGDGNTAELLCKSNVINYTVTLQSDMSSSKWVKGKLDGDYSRYPIAGNTDLTGDGVYQMFIENTGNASMTQLEVVDIMPFVGDNGVLPASGTRLSEWSEELSGAITVERWNSGTQTWVAVPGADLPLGLQYSTATNPCRFTNAVTNNLDLTAANGGVGPSGCTTNPWASSPAADARSFSFRFLPSVQFAPGEKLRITVPVRVNGNPPGCNDPLCVGDVLTNNAVAWNSFAYGSYYNNAGVPTRLLDTEPIKVGLKMADLTTHTSLGNYVWYDDNYNGIQDVFENPVVGVQVSLWNSAGTTLLQTTTTDSYGFYRFYGLNTSTTYLVRLDNLADFNGGALSGYALTIQNSPSTTDLLDSDAALNGNGNPQITATTGPVTGIDLPADPTEYPSYDFGFFQTNCVGDYVWYDANSNGTQDNGEKPVVNATVKLFSVGPDGGIGGGDDVQIGSTLTTDANGFYQFNNIPNGTYYVQFSKTTITGIDPITGLAVLPANWIFTAPFLTGNDFNDSDANQVNGNSNAFTLTGNVCNISIDAGLKPSVTNPATIKGTVWGDCVDGIRQVGEQLLANVQVVLLNSSGIPVASAYTDGLGRYEFTGLTPNVPYQVWFVKNSTSTFTLQNQGGNDLIDSDADPVTGLAPSVTPANNATIDNIDAGLCIPPLIGNRVWKDTDSAGDQDASEAGIPGVTVTLHDMTAGGAQVGSTVTDVNGLYYFGGYDNLNMTPIPVTNNVSVSSTINLDSDDAEETTGGAFTSSSSDLDLGFDGANQNLAGVRFTGISIPQGATIVSANIQFSADNSAGSSGSPVLVIKGDDTDNALTFVNNATQKISVRPVTTASVNWSPAAWSTNSERGANQLSPNVGTIVQEIVDRTGWSSGNAMAFIISTTSASGLREAENFGEVPAGAATLTITYTAVGSTPRALLASTSYEVRVGVTQGIILPCVLTGQNTGGVTSNSPTLDDADSDAALSGSNAVIALTSPAAGGINRGYDFGFKAPSACAITVTSATPTACDPLDNTYDLAVTVTYSTPPTGNITVTTTTGASISVPQTGSPQVITLTGLQANGYPNVGVTAAFANDMACTHTLTSAYTAPTDCWGCTGNLLVNPSFETGALNTSPPTGWMGGGQIAGNNMQEPDGTQYAFATFPATNIYQDVAATPGSTFTLTFYSGAHVPGVQTVSLRYLDASMITLGTPAVHNVIYDTDLTTPQQLGGPYTLTLGAAPAGTAFVRVEANNNNVDFVKVDAFCLTTTAPPCPSITNPSAAQNICVGSAGSNITVNTDQNTSNSIRFVRFTSDQMSGATPNATEAANIYGGATIVATVTPTGASNPYTATLTAATAGWSALAPGTYYIYAIFNPDLGASCRPLVEIVVTINPAPTITLGANPTVCQGTTSASLPYTATTGTPNQYSIDYNAAANTAGF
ncbi:MAG: hypothetical protein IT262_22775, partial [Saprospiraceae bacterium]|nr:hypothetical protein [Saprospiraceae bacterium]